MSDVLKNANQIHQYLHTQGWRGSYNKIRADIDRGLLTPRRGGGFTTHSAESYARAHLTRTVDTNPAQDTPLFKAPDEEMQGVAERRALAHAKKLEVQELREKIKLQKDMGQLVETATVEAELAARAKAFRLGLESFALDASERVAAIFGGEEETARKLLAALDLDATLVPVVIDFSLSCTPRFRELWAEMIQDFLDPYASETWWTEEMQNAWELREKTEQEASHD